MLSGVRITILMVFVTLLFIFRIKNSENMQVLKRHEHHKRGIVILTCSTKAEVMLREAVNICKNVTWDGWITKTRRVQEETSKMHPNNLVAVVDSDVLKNVDDIESELTKAWALWGSQKVVYSTEPFCWIGHNCDFVDFQKFYKLNPNWRGYNFVNGGGFIGTANAISKVLQFLIANIKSLVHQMATMISMVLLNFLDVEWLIWTTTIIFLALLSTQSHGGCVIFSVSHLFTRKTCGRLAL